MLYRLLFLCLLLSISSHVYSQKLLKDIASSDASALISGGGLAGTAIRGDTLFFIAKDTTSDYMNIWFTNGTTANTKNVTRGNVRAYYDFLATFKGKVYYKSLINSNLYSTVGNDTTIVKTITGCTIRKAMVMGNWLYLFVIKDSSLMVELWKTDGTGANTTKVTDLLSTPYLEVDNFFNAGDKIYFSLFSSPHGNEPWVTDGTAGGTKILKDIIPGADSSLPYGFEKVGNNVFFFADPPNTTFHKLWKTDGTEAGTVVVTNEIEGNADYYSFGSINYNNQLFFMVNPDKLYKTDGNTITLVMADLAVYGGFFQMNNVLYFLKKIGDDYELWKSNGTAAGTQKITTMHIPQTYIVHILVGASKIYFQFSYFSNDTFQNTTQHWVTDGTAPGTINLHTLNPNFSTGSFENQIAVVGDTYYFAAYDDAHGFELWKSDGTPLSTMMVKNINTGIASSFPAQFVALNNEVFFMANDMKHSEEIWKTDGTQANTQLYMDYNVSGFGGENYTTYISGMIAYNDVIIAMAAGKLVKFSQTVPPTVIARHNLLDAMNPEFIQCNNKIFYRGFVNNGYQLFVTDGNTSNKVKDLPITSPSWYGPDPTNFSVLGNELYFTINNYTQLWKTDGTEAGTVLVKDFSPGQIGTKFYAVNGLMLFGLDNSTYGYELWKTDGTEAGTQIVKDIYPGPGSSNVGYLKVFNGQLFFNAYNGSTSHLYKSDGTTANTQIVGDRTTSYVQTVFKNKLYFISNDYYGTPYYLWSTDGISAPVKIQKVGESTLQYPDVTILKNIDDKLLVFNMLPADSREELWVSDGTASGTKLAKVIRNKSSVNYDINIKEFLYLNNKLYFAADDGVNGKELWVWDFNCPEFMTITSPISQDTEMVVEKYITGSNKINPGKKVSYNANKYITLNPGFETQSGSQFTTSMSGCINYGFSSNSMVNSPATTNSITSTGEPFFKNFPSKADARPSIIQFLDEPSNAELKAVYLSERNNPNGQKIASIIEESPDKYILKMYVNDKEYIGYLPK